MSRKTVKKSKSRSKKQTSHAKLEVAIISLVVVVAAIGLFMMYQSSVGRAFLTAPAFKVIQTEPQFCCCKTDRGFYFEVFGAVVKNSEPFMQTQKCTDLCTNEYQPTGRTYLLANVGECGATPPVVRRTQ